MAVLYTLVSALLKTHSNCLHCLSKLEQCEFMLMRTNCCTVFYQKSHSIGSLLKDRGKLQTKQRGSVEVGPGCHPPTFPQAGQAALPPAGPSQQQGGKRLLTRCPQLEHHPPTLAKSVTRRNRQNNQMDLNWIGLLQTIQPLSLHN